MNAIYLTHQQVSAVALMLQDSDDEQLKLDVLEGETDLFEWTRFLLEKNEEDEGMVSALKGQISARQKRKSAAEGRIKRRREALLALLECAKLKKLKLPEATLSVSTTAARLAVNDPDAVPDEYCVHEPKPSAEKIAAKFTVDSENLPNWLRVEPEKPFLTVRG